MPKIGGWRSTPSHGEELGELAREVMAQPADVVERMKRLLEK